MNKTQLIQEFNQLRDTAPKSIKPLEYLNSLSDHELTVFIAGKTYQFGRSFEDSWENGSYWMKNRDKAILQFAKVEIYTND